MMISNIFINLLSLLIFLIFVFISFLDLTRNNRLFKSLFLSSLLFSFIGYLVSFLSISQGSYNIITIVLFLSLSLLLGIYLVFCFFNFNFIKLRVLFIPYFFMLISFCYLSFLITQDTQTNSIQLFENNFLTFHIILSMLSYSFLTVSAISSISAFLQQKNLKNSGISYNNLYEIFPSIYESEKATILLLYVTQFFLFLSLITGYFYSLKLSGSLSFFSDYKFTLSLITFLLIFLLLIIRHYLGLTGKKIFNVVLLSFLFINVAYFGFKLIK